jgi:hypothetical protein
VSEFEPAQIRWLFDQTIMAMISTSGTSAKWRSDTSRGSTLRNEVAGAPEKNASVLLRNRI